MSDMNASTVSCAFHHAAQMWQKPADETKLGMLGRHVCSRVWMGLGAAEGAIKAVNSAAMAVFNLVLWTASLFRDADIRASVGTSVQDTVAALKAVFSSAFGVLCPAAGKWVDVRISPAPVAVAAAPAV